MADYSDYKECTECVHYELCLHQEKFLIEHNRKDLIRRYGFGLSEPEICCNFRDRSRFVELPANGIMYGIIDGRGTELLNLIVQPGDTGMCVLSPDNINKTIFSTKEQAEQALKERGKQKQAGVLKRSEKNEAHTGRNCYVERHR